MRKGGLGKWKGITLINIIPIIMMGNIFSFIFNFISSTLLTILIIIFTRPTIIVISVPPGESSFGSYIAAKLFRNKVVFDYRDEWEDYVLGSTMSSLYKTLYEGLKIQMTKCYLNSDLMITVTEALANSLSLRGIRRVKIISNGADSNVFKPYNKDISRNKIGIQKNVFVFVYIGVIGLYYKLDVVLKAYKKTVTDTDNTKLLLVGVGPDIDAVLQLAKEINLQDRIIYLGPKDDRIELAQILSASDVGIVPFDANPLWKHALPSKCMEYFACGLPVVATVYNDSVLGKLIQENNIGLICDPEDTDGLANIMSAISKDSFFVRDAGKRAVSLIRERYDRNNLAKEFHGLLRGLCNVSE